MRTEESVSVPKGDVLGHQARCTCARGVQCFGKRVYSNCAQEAISKVRADVCA